MVNGFSFRISCAALLGVLCLVHSAGAAPPSAPGPFGRPGPGFKREGARQSQSPPDASQTAPIQRGFVLLKGRYLPPPYTVQWRDAGLYVNDIRVPALNHTQVVQTEMGKTRWRLHYPAVAVAWAEQELRGDGLLLLVDERTAGFVPAYQAICMVDLLESKQTVEAKVEGLAGFGLAWINSGQWAKVIETFQPSPELTERCKVLRTEWEEVSRKNNAEASRSDWGPALTFLGLGLTVLGFGLLVGGRPVPRFGWTGTDDSAEARRLVWRCVMLLVIFNLFDLGCTLLALRSGGLWELNPLAGSLAGNQHLLGLAKITVIGLVAVCFLAGRRYRLTQASAWWACLLHAVLMLRWSTYNSLFLDCR